jgi:hypothetical protein
MSDRPSHVGIGLVFVLSCIFAAVVLYLAMRPNGTTTAETLNSQAQATERSPNAVQYENATEVAETASSGAVEAFEQGEDDSPPCIGTWQVTNASQEDALPTAVVIATDADSTIHFTARFSAERSERGEAMLPASIPNVVNYVTLDGTTSYSLSCNHGRRGTLEIAPNNAAEEQPNESARTLMVLRSGD